MTFAKAVKRTVLMVVFGYASVFAAPNASASSQTSRADLRAVFRSPLIMGASVSSGFATKGPGTRAAERFTSSANIKNIARVQMPAAKYTNINATLLRKHSVVIAVDLLFWDSVAGFGSGDTIGVLDNLIKTSASLKIPLVIGDVPELIPFQFSRDQLNRELRTRCQVKNRCYILPLVELHRRANDEGIVISGRTYSFNELTTDGLHLNSIASQYVANMIVKILSRN